MSGSSACQCCRSISTDEYRVPWPLLRHLDFTDVASSGRIVECRDCGAVAAADEARVAVVHEDFLFAATYLAAAPTAHVVRGAGSAADTRSARQADWIARHLAERGVANPRVLDVGCFDGALLTELFARCPTALRLAGFDPNPDVAGLFPKEQPFEFHASLASVEGGNHPFDVIIASHSLMYDRRLPETVGVLANLLSEDGLLILLMPDIARNPPYLLMGDQYWFGVPAYLNRLLSHHGLESLRGSGDDWGHDLVLLASATLQASRPASPDPVTPHMPAVLAGLEESAHRLRSLPSSGPGYHVLGRTANAAFAATILGEQCIGFVDEAIEQGQSRLFRGLPAMHPADLSGRVATSGIAVCYGERNHKISERLKRFGLLIFCA